VLTHHQQKTSTCVCAVLKQREMETVMSATTGLVSVASSLEAGPAIYATTAHAAAALPVPTVAETVAYGAGPTGGLSNSAANAPINAEPVVQQLMLAEQAKRRLEVTLKLLAVQYSAERSFSRHAILA
jgi:hypothetical protein